MKRFEPTPARLERARRDGDHPLSRDAIAVATFCGALFGLLAVMPIARSAIVDGLRMLVGSNGTPHIAAILCIAVVVTSACGAAGAVLATLVQTRGLSLRPLAFRLSLAQPLGIDAAGGVARSFLAVIAGMAAVALAARPSSRAIVSTLDDVLVVGVVAAGIDMVVVHKGWRRRLRMTFDELRRDMREHDGDPNVRARRRRMHRSMVRGSVRHIRRATFVVVNPTHVAIALRYVPEETAVPMILIRVADEGALRVRKLADEIGIPTIENPPLARQLYVHDALGPIPPELYIAVAQIIATLSRER
ncbi:MAG: EscU/YscU/HrcU family type III secretion system export apparatus switch protein [Vulcanimicrobiaceae bacterium]